MKIGRNDPCHCGSGLKYKKCHAPKDEAARAAEAAARAEALAKEAASANETATTEEGMAGSTQKGSGPRSGGGGAPRPWQKGFPSTNLPRRGAV